MLSKRVGRSLRKRGRDITTRCLGGRRVPHLHERGRLREIEARKLGVVEGGVSYRCNRGRDHKSALKVGVRESGNALSPQSPRARSGRLPAYSYTYELRQGVAR